MYVILSPLLLWIFLRKHNCQPFYICTFSVYLSLKINIHWNWLLFRKVPWILWLSTNEQIHIINHNKKETVVRTHHENKTKLPQSPCYSHLKGVQVDTLLAPLNQSKPLNYQPHYSLAFCHYPHKCHMWLFKAWFTQIVHVWAIHCSVLFCCRDTQQFAYCVPGKEYLYRVYSNWVWFRMQ